MVFPMFDENPFTKPKWPYVTWAIIVLNVAIFVFQASAPDEIQRAILASFAAVPAALSRDVSSGVLPELTLVTSMFLHGGWEHLLGNMVYLWVFGDDIEEALGPLRYIVFYLGCGIMAALAFIAFNAHSTVPLVGASGAISGVLAAYLMIRPCAKVSVFVLRVVLRVRAYWVIGLWVLLQVFFFASADDSDNVAYLAHLGGLVAGIVLLFGLKPDGLRLFQCIGEGDTFSSVFGR